MSARADLAHLPGHQLGDRTRLITGRLELGDELEALRRRGLRRSHDPARGPFADVLAALVRAGLPVEAAAFDPPWPAQLAG